MIPPEYSSNIAAAWKVVEKLQIYLSPGSAPGRWGAFIAQSGVDMVWLDSAPLAICVVALRAKGIEVQE